MEISSSPYVVITYLLHLYFVSTAAVVQPQPETEILSDSKVNLTFMMITSWGGFGFNSSGTLPAAEIALNLINSRPDILPGYNLVYDEIRDSKCNRQSSLDTFFDGIMSGVTKIGVIGCGCSVATEPVAEIIHQWNIPLISYGTTSASLSNTSIYRNYYRANPPSTSLTPAIYTLMQQFHWNRLGIVTQDENRFRKVEDSIRKELTPSGIEVQSQRYHTEEDPRNVQDLFIESDDFRVLLLNSYPNSKIICEISKRQHLHPNYTWLTYGWYAQASWTNANIVNCTEDQLKRVLEHGISIEVFPFADDMNVRTFSGLTPQEFQNQYQTAAKADDYEVLETTAAQLYDDVWGLALALNATMTMVKNCNIAETDCEDVPGDLVPLENFTYGNTKMGCLISWNLRKTNFSGASGAVFFNETLVRHRATLQQYVLIGSNLTRLSFATADRCKSFTFEYEPGFNNEALFPDGIPPDGEPETVLQHVLLPIAVVVDILSFFGLVFAVVCLLFNVIFRERVIVKLTSPNLNYFIIAGTICMYASIYFYLIPSTKLSISQASCVIREWFFTIGYTLAYGAMLAKVWRVYKIFHDPRPKKRIFRDWELVVFTLIVTAIVLFLLLLGTAIPILRGTVSVTDDLETPDGISSNGVKIKYSVLVCYRDVGPALYWKIFIFAYLVVLQILGIMLAFQTRRVKVKSLKDSSFVVANVYISSTVIVVFILATFVLRSYLNVYSTVYACGIFILTTTFLILSFVPKMIILYKDPDGKSMKDTLSGTSTFQKNFSDTDINKATNKQDSSEWEKKVMSLEKKVSEQCEIIDQMKIKMKYYEESFLTHSNGNTQ